MSKKLYFVGIPKCAYKSISNIIRKRKYRKRIYDLGHAILSEKDFLMSKKNDVLYFSNIRSPFQWYFSWWRYRVNKVALAKKYDKKLYNRYKKRISFFETIDGANFKIKDNSYFRRWVDFQLSTNPIYGSMTSNIIKYWFCNNAELFLDNYYNNPLDNYIIKHFVKVEDIKNDLESIGVFEKEIPHINKSGKQKKSYTKFYSNKQIDLILKKDKYIFEKFGYTVPRR